MIPREPGVYALVMEYGCSGKVVVGRRIVLEPPSNAILVYVGSALGPGGLKARILRHLRRQKRIHWHIDYLTTLDCVHVRAIAYAVIQSRGAESCLARACAEELAMGPRGFGSTDDRSAITHLFYSSSGGLWRVLETVGGCFRRCGLEARIVSSL